MNERKTEKLTYNSVIDTKRQQNRESEQQDSESDDAQSTDPDHEVFRLQFWTSWGSRIKRYKEYL